MPTPSEPEKYSIEEMMEQLQNRQTQNQHDKGEGELVTREDGSLAIKVRSRKRRSQQPHKEEQRSSRRVRMIQVSAALIALVLTIFGVVAAIIFANSTAFREKILRNIALSSGATVELEQFRMNPTSANAGQITLTWPPSNVLQTLTANNLRADTSLASFLGNSLTGDEVSCSAATLTLHAPNSDQTASKAPATTSGTPVRFKRYASLKTQVLLGDPAAPPIRMLNSEVSFYPAGANESSQLLLSRGNITIQGWPKLRLDRSHIEFRSNVVDIVAMRLRHESDNRGLFELTGTIFPYATDRSSTLAIRLEDYLLTGIAGAELGRLVGGRIDTLPNPDSNHLTCTLGPSPSATLNIVFRNSASSAIEINGFPFLFGLSQTLGDSWFERPAFVDAVRGVLRRTAGTVTIDQLNMENKDRMALRGTLAMAPDQTLTGKFEVGIVNAMIKASNTRTLDSLFGPQQDGFRWLTLKIGGTATAPTDNFKELFTATAKQAPKPEPSTTIPSFEDLTKPQ